MNFDKQDRLCLSALPTGPFASPDPNRCCWGEADKHKAPTPPHIHPQPSPVPLHLARPPCPVHLSTAPSPGGGAASPDM